jgi:hypothetical protein
MMTYTLLEGSESGISGTVGMIVKERDLWREVTGVPEIR